MNEEQLKALLAGLLAPLQTQLNTLGSTVEGLTKVQPQPAPQPQPPPTPAPQPAPQPAPTPAPAPQPQPQSTDPAVNAQIAEMRRVLEEQKKATDALQKAKEEADKRADEAERASVLDRALGEFQFREGGTARQTAITLLSPHIKRNEAGQLIAGDNLTVEAFAKDFIPKSHDYLLAPVGGGGAGVTPTSAAFAGRKAPDLNDIKPGMSAETRTAVLAAMQAAATEQSR